MNDATLAIQDIQDALAEYGSSVTLQLITRGAYDTTTGETADVVVNTPLKALPQNYDTRDIDGVKILATDIRFLLYYDGEIGDEDKIVFNSVTYNLLKIDKKILQDANLLYTLQGRA